MSWENQILERVAKISKGKKHQENSAGSGFRYLQIQDLTHNDNVKHTAEKGVDVNASDVIIAWDGANAGIVGAGLTGVVGSTLARIRPIDSKVLHGKYLYRYLQSQEHNIRADRTGATIPHVNGIKLRATTVPLPPLPVQEHIAAILDEADALRKKDAALLKKYDELLQSIFYDMFGVYITNAKKSLVDFTEVNPKKSEQKIQDDTLVSFVPMTNVGEDGSIDLSIVKKYSEVSSGFTYFTDGDVLFAKITPCMENGKGAIALGLKNKIGFGSTEFHVIRPSEKMNAEFIYMLLHLKETRLLAEKNMTGSAGQKRVRSDFFEKLKIDLPPILLMNKFKEVYSSITEQRKTILTQHTQSVALFQSLLQRAFKGELVG